MPSHLRTSPQAPSALCWFRRDLRDHDHAALTRALDHGGRVHCLFVFDRAILDRLEQRADRRVEFILESVRELDAALRARGGGLIVRHGDAATVVPALARGLRVDAVFVNRDYEPDARRRDAAVRGALAEFGIGFHESKDQVIFERDEILTQAGRPYSVYTPYRNAWLNALAPADLAPHVSGGGGGALAPPPPRQETLPTLEHLGFRSTNLTRIPVRTGMSGAADLFAQFLERIDRYHQTRDFPATAGSSNLSVHLRFGTVSVRTLAAHAHALMLQGSTGAATWLSELIWRDFYFMILDRHPRVAGHAFKPEFDALPFPNDPERFAAWCEGRTGYPLVDAALRQLNATGQMHNRLRMVTASFLVKDLHVDWRWGERYFAAHLNDYDLAANNGGWQWAASTGCDAQPYFRIFNPVTQSERFDPDGAYIRRHVPELAALPAKHIHAPWTLAPVLQHDLGVVIGRDYPYPVVDHAAARKFALALYGVTAPTGTP
ncbi:MAG: deoxyribodipyrimidine photo-lyase [Betaproteobacteria bacterium]|nr:deoxyribodipyrimidine photo-lyase [Betaproteobacteria bacterium]